MEASKLQIANITHESRKPVANKFFWQINLFYVAA
jgi:hypothetical protein